MAASPPPLPRLDENAIIGVWVETSIWGMNCIIYAVAMYVLLKRLNNPKLLAVTSTLLFLMGTTHVALSLTQLLEAFIRVPVPTPPGYSILYWANNAEGKAVAKTVLYDTSVFIQDLVLIWRLYVVWNHNWKVIVFPLLVELAHMSCAYALTGILSRPGVDIHAPEIVRFGPVGWVLDLVVNICVTVAISGRLWYMGTKVKAISGKRNMYISTIFTIIESGAIFAIMTIVMLGVYESGSVVVLNLIDITTQLAIMTPLLIIARVGIGMVHGLPETISFAYPTRSGGESSTQIFKMDKMGTGSHSKGGVMMSKEYSTVVASESQIGSKGQFV